VHTQRRNPIWRDLQLHRRLPFGSAGKQYEVECRQGARIVADVRDEHEPKVEFSLVGQLAPACQTPYVGAVRSVVGNTVRCVYRQQQKRKGVPAPARVGGVECILPYYQHARPP
jgi:hypothetical protein